MVFTTLEMQINLKSVKFIHVGLFPNRYHRELHNNKIKGKTKRDTNELNKQMHVSLCLFVL